MIKSNQDFFIKSQQQLIVRLYKMLDWTIDSSKRIQKAETDAWYLNWKVGYLEKRLKELEIPLYADDDADIRNLKNNLRMNGKDGKEEHE